MAVNNIFSQKRLVAVFVLSFLFVVGGLAWCFFALRGSSGPLILHFNDILGISQIGSLYDLLGVGALGAVMVVVNFILSAEAHKRSREISWLMAGATIFFSVLLFIGFAAIISVN